MHRVALFLIPAGVAMMVGSVVFSVEVAVKGVRLRPVGSGLRVAMLLLGALIFYSGISAYLV